MLSASIGTTFELASYVYSSSYTCCMIVPTRSAVEAIGSSVCGSPIIAMFAAPPFGGAAHVGALMHVTATTAANSALSRRTVAARRAGWGVEYSATARNMAPPGRAGVRPAVVGRRVARL